MRLLDMSPRRASVPPLWDSESLLPSFPFHPVNSRLLVPIDPPLSMPSCSYCSSGEDDQVPAQQQSVLEVSVGPFDMWSFRAWEVSICSNVELSMIEKLDLGNSITTPSKAKLEPHPA